MAGIGAIGCLSLVLGILASAFGPTGVLAQERLVITVTVYNRSKVGTPTLTAGESNAQEVFRRAGVESIWVNCPVPSAPEANPECSLPPGPTRLILTILPHWADQGADSEALGLALEAEHGFGSYCYVFRDHLDELAATMHVNQARLLGHAMAHEIGHLLKGSNSHSAQGLMSGHWYANEIQALALGSLNFTAEDAALMRIRLAQAATNR